MSETSLHYHRWLKTFDDMMRKQQRKVCLHLDNFSGHYVSYEPTNVELIFFAPNLTSWVQPLDAGIIRCFKAHYRRRFCQEALKRDSSGQADIYSFNLLETLHMACDAWDDVTAETINNCWDHTDIQVAKQATAPNSFLQYLIVRTGMTSRCRFRYTRSSILAR